MKQLRIIFSFLKETAHSFAVHRGSMLAAALAYYMIFSVAPLLIISIALAEQFLNDTNVQLLLITRIRVLAGSEVSEIVRSLIQGTGQNSTSLVATLLSIGFILFGASNVFRQLKRALNIIWGVPFEEEVGIFNFFKTNLLAFSLVILSGLLLLSAVLMNALAGVVNAFLGRFLPQSFRVSFIFEYAVPAIVTIVLFALLFRILPDIQISWRDVWLGAVVTTVLMSIGIVFLRLYIRYSSVGAAYGAAGSLVVLLIFIYYNAQIFLLGVEFTKVYTNRYGSRANKKPSEDVEPSDGQVDN
jgi:membrane protein